MGGGVDCVYMRLEYEVEGHRPHSCVCVVYGGLYIYISIYIYIYIYIYICVCEYVCICIYVGRWC